MEFEGFEHQSGDVTELSECWALGVDGAGVPAQVCSLDVGGQCECEGVGVAAVGCFEEVDPAEVGEDLELGGAGGVVAACCDGESSYSEGEVAGACLVAGFCQGPHEPPDLEADAQEPVGFVGEYRSRPGSDELVLKVSVRNFARGWSGAPR